MKKILLALLPFLAAPSIVAAGEDDFIAGTAIPEYGRIAPVEDPRLGAETAFRVAYDVAEAAEEGEVNRRFVTLARFINMHVNAGVPQENIALALVVHGPASKELLDQDDNPNAGIIAALVDAGVRIELCGQSAAWYDISQEDVLPGVTVTLSAMTSHALLQQEGYTLNPF